jgi:hypothetical protein
LQKRFIVITTINHPTEAIKKIPEIAGDWQILIVADKKTPADWSLPGAFVITFDQQLNSDSQFARACPQNHYARKNIGYLRAIAQGARIIAETDDDNIPKDNFLTSVNRSLTARRIEQKGWQNIYTHFTDENVWPRGFPLDLILDSFENKSPLSPPAEFDCPIQQYLADGDPDVDALYRLTNKKEINFRSNYIVLPEGSFCPFNSQNTIWWPQAFPLMYLPSFVSFRMTDIWRSFIAQVCLYKAGKTILFGPPTVYQSRNAHDLLKDLKDEIPGYLNNKKILQLLTALPLSKNPSKIPDNMRLCYERLAAEQIIPHEELPLLDLWLNEINVFLRPGFSAKNHVLSEIDSQ